MYNYYAILASLGTAILLSPEITVFGLVAASDDRNPRLFSWAFGFGTIIGLAFALIIGFMLAKTHNTTIHEASWAGFAVRATIASSLFIIGIYQLVNALRKTPIHKKQGQAEHSMAYYSGLWLKSHFPSIANRFDGSMEISNKQRAIHWGLLGFACDGLHPKIFPIVIAAGHETLQSASIEARIIGLLMFTAIALIPGFIPAVVETIHHGIASKIKESFETFMKRYGRFISTAFILTVTVLVGMSAKNNIPAPTSVGIATADGRFSIDKN